MPVKHETMLPMKSGGHVLEQISYVDNILACDECLSNNIKTDPNGYQVCQDCGLVLSEKVLVQTYKKPKINFKTPTWRKPTHYDTEFMALLDTLNSPDIINFDYTLDGSYNRVTRTHNSRELILSLIEDAPTPVTDYTSISRGHHELGRHVVQAEAPFTKLQGGTMTDYFQEYVERSNHKLHVSGRGVGTKSPTQEPHTPLTLEEMQAINQRVNERRENLKRRDPIMYN